MELSEQIEPLEIGKGEIVYKSQVQVSKIKTDHKIQDQSSKICIISVGSMVYPAKEAAKFLLKDGIAATVINARYVKPLDNDLILNTVKSVDKVVTIEEGVLEGGFGSAILELFSSEGIDLPVQRLGIPDKFIEQGTRAELLDICGLTTEKIYRAIK